MMPKPFAVAPVLTQPAQDAFEGILSHAGATLPSRDAVDRRVIANVQLGKFGLINSQTDVGGWPALQSTAPLPDSDNDGMPDEWESRHGITDHSADPDNDGYTNIEEFLNSTNPKVPEPGTP